MDFEKLISRCIAKMEAENLTNKDLAQLAQISESTVSRVLASRGANASAATITAICDALGVGAEAAQYEVAVRERTKDELYEARIDDLQRRIKKETHEKRIIFIAFLFTVAFVFILFAVDLLNPNVGWFRA